MLIPTEVGIVAEEKAGEHFWHKWKVYLLNALLKKYLY